MPTNKPNILIFWGDDIGRFNLSAYNHSLMGYRTPNIDRIAREGVMFTDWYGQQSCIAGRAAFITGPPRQSPESWPPGAMMEQLRKRTDALRAGASLG